MIHHEASAKAYPTLCPTAPFPLLFFGSNVSPPKRRMNCRHRRPQPDNSRSVGARRIIDGFTSTGLAEFVDRSAAAVGDAFAGSTT